MKQKFLLLMLLLILRIGAFEANAQYLVVQTTDGAENTSQVSSIQNLKFSSSSLVLNFTSGSADTYSLSNISKLYFTSTSGIETNNETEISIYPNPVNSTIYIQNAPKGESTVSIYRLDGVMVSRTQISAESNAVSVDDLSKGLYLIKVNNQAFKFIKL